MQEYTEKYFMKGKQVGQDLTYTAKFKFPWNIC